MSSTPARSTCRSSFGAMDLRAAQGYLFKAPAELLELFEQLAPLRISEQAESIAEPPHVRTRRSLRRPVGLCALTDRALD